MQLMAETSHPGEAAVLHQRLDNLQAFRASAQGVQGVWDLKLKVEMVPWTCRP